ncbi:MAG: hypothetical protein OXE85_01310 [Roseovarius sp.]|nr:hypothetical protein [Roseovarius sp.]
MPGWDCCLAAVVAMRTWIRKRGCELQGVDPGPDLAAGITD